MPAVASYQDQVRCFGETGGADLSTPPLISSRLILRNYQPSDAEDVCQAIQETRTSLLRWVPDIAQHQTIAGVRTALGGLAHRVSRGDRHIFGVWHAATCQFLGEVGIYSVDRDARSGDIGYWFRQTAHGRGYAQEAVALLLDYADWELGLRQFEAHIAIDNAPSVRLAERLGFQVSGRRAPAAPWDGHVDDVIIYGLHRPGAC
jgi:RimJ/RimL family protein N-acetyltransferase